MSTTKTAVPKRSTDTTNVVAAPVPETHLVLGTGVGEDPHDSPASRDGKTNGKTNGQRAGANAYGFFSIETFANSSPLTYTHDDAQGFYDYVAGFTAPNFWYRDGNVANWAYYEEFDNWQDTYGADAVNVMYHSGHGGRLADGRVWFPMGASWSDQGSDAWSDQMRLGNERANYLFWSTCLACPVYAPLNPLSAWGNSNLGFRMLFGFETISYDNPNYGRYFFEEWNKGKSFSTAWMDASWRISTGQVPSVVAVGANQAEAADRLYNERSFAWQHASRDWWEWRWYNAARMAPSNMATREKLTAIPDDLSVAQLRPIQIGENVLRSEVNRYGLPLTVPREITVSRTGAYRVVQDNAGVAFGADGSVEAQLAASNYRNRNQLSLDQVAAIAQEAVSLYGLNRDAQLVFDSVRYAMEAGGSAQGGGELLDPFVTETTVQFKQLINGLPVVTPGAGEVRVSVDNDGTVTRVADSTRTVDRLTRGNAQPTPAPDGTEVSARASADSAEARLGASWARHLSRWALRGQMPVGYSVVPATTEIGYAVAGDQATLVASRDIEVDFGNGLYKRYRVEAPITG